MAGPITKPQTRGRSHAALVSMPLDIEDHFDISSPLDRLARFRTVENLAAYIVSRLGKH